MAVNRVSGGTVLRLEFQTGLDPQGNPVYRNKNLSGIRQSASDQDLFDVANALAGLQEHALNGISRIDSNRLVQV